MAAETHKGIFTGCGIFLYIFHLLSRRTAPVLNLLHLPAAFAASAALPVYQLRKRVGRAFLPAGEPVIDTEPPRTSADQPDKEEHVQDFRKVEEIVEPVQRRKPFRHGGKLVGQDGDQHIGQ